MNGKIAHVAHDEVQCSSVVADERNDDNGRPGGTHGYNLHMGCRLQALVLIIRLPQLIARYCARVAR